MAEYQSMRLLIPAIASPHDIRAPLYADIQPLAPRGQIVRTILKNIPLLVARGAERVVVLIDIETRNECSGTFASDIERDVRNQNQYDCEVYVVMKTYRYENWLVGAISSMRRQRARFPGSDRIIQRISPNKADNVDAIELLERAIPNNSSYEKVQDSKRIMKNADPYEIASNSRSFRKFLRVIDNPRYENQSQLP